MVAGPITVLDSVVPFRSSSQLTDSAFLVGHVGTTDKADFCMESQLSMIVLISGMSVWTASSSASLSV